jgi:hypothetical protein
VTLGIDEVRDLARNHWTVDGAHRAAVVAAETTIRDGWEHDLGRVLDMLRIDMLRIGGA